MTALPRTMTDIAAALRHQLDESERKRDIDRHERESADARNAKLHAENIELRRQVDEARALLISSADDFVRVRRTSFLARAYYESRMLNAQLRLDIETHKRWHLEHGAEAGRLQETIAARDQEIGELTRALDLARAGERCDTTEVE